MNDGKDLRTYMTQRYASNMVFMSLLLSTELGVLFNSSVITTNVRHKLRDGDHWTLSFWAGLFIITSALLTILSLISTFTAWAMVNSVDAKNAHCIFRSSIGQYAAELPGRLIVCSIYSFLISFIMYFFLLLPFGVWSITLLIITLCLFVHIVSVFSALGRIIMHSGAMGRTPIFTPTYEESLLPHSLHSNLLAKSKANLENKTSIIRQYRTKQDPIDRYLTEGQMYDHLFGEFDGNHVFVPQRSRTDSTVRFADEEQGGGIRRCPRTNERNLPSVSDTSTSRSSEASFELKDDANMTTSSQSSDQKNSGLQRPCLVSRPPSLPVPTPFGADALKSVSNSSLEVWLQASPASNVEDSGGIFFTSPMSEKSPPSASSTPQTTNRSPPGPPMQIARAGSPATGIPRPNTPTTPALSELTMDDRELSEDERFKLDYGDNITDNDPFRNSNDLRRGEKESLLNKDNTYHPYFSYASDSTRKKDLSPSS
jgi:hypothetical protein